MSSFSNLSTGRIKVEGSPSFTNLGTPSAPSTYTATASSSEAVAVNANRKGLVVINLGTVNVSFGCGVTAVVNSGITLLPNGTWVMDQFTFTTAAINAVAATGTSVLSIQEYV